MAGVGSSGVELEDFRIPLQEIKLSTDDFSPENYIGGGGFGKVYRAKLSISGSHTTAAVKRLDPQGLQGKHEFLNEISMLFSYRHENIINFIGYCDEADEMIVVYDYAANQSLDKYLRDSGKISSMSWEQRLKICIGAARGLDYLHSGLGEHHRVIHRDIKSANILLDENFVAKISDFGLSKIGPKDLPYTNLHTKVAGTMGYCDPNYYGTEVLKKESDVYSFGVVLFEMLCGRLVYKKRGNEEDEPESLVEWVRCCYKDGEEKIIDPHLRDEIKAKSLSSFLEIAYGCIKMNVKKRPTMATILEKLEEALEFQVEKRPTMATVVENLEEALEFQFDHAKRIQEAVDEKVAVIFDDPGVKELLVKLYREEWHEGQVTEYLVATFADSFTDWKMDTEGRSFRRFVEACLEQTVIVYVDHLLTQKNYIKEETIERLRLDEEILLDFFREYISIGRVEYRLQILMDLRELASANSLGGFTLVYSNILEHHPDCPPDVVKKLVGLREGIPWKDAKQVVRECKEIYENSLIDGNPPKRGFVFSKVKCLSSANDLDKESMLGSLYSSINNAMANLF